MTGFVPEPLCVSASRLTMLGGEKGTPGCERKVFGAYLHGLKQAGSAATDFGSALHSAAEVYQDTGALSEPESRVSTVLSAGIHLLSPWDTALATSGPAARLLVEYEHRGLLPALADGTRVPFLAYLDGHSPDGGATNCVVVQDLKTTSDRKYALNADAQSDYYLGWNIQAMFYAAIMACVPHQFRKDEHSEWQEWDPEARGAATVRLRWLYFLTRGTEHAWDVSVFVTAEQAQQFLDGTIMPLVEKMTALHRWHEANPSASLDEIDRNLASCTRRGSAGHWCGVGEHKACNYAALGTPIQLLQLGKKRNATPMTDTPQSRLEALRARRNAGASAAPPPDPTPEPAPAPKAAPPSPAELTSTTAEPAAPVSAPAPSAAVATPAPEATPKPRGRPRARPTPPAAVSGDCPINPPAEAAAALAAITQEVTTGNIPTTTGLDCYSVEELLRAAFRRVMA